MVPHLPLPEPVDEEEQEGQREDGGDPAGHEPKPDVGGPAAVFELTVVTYKNN